ncbi:MAG: hypothetical protein GC165_03965 [Armatimonadetes bacterium]|nr:hypothetical protein [Armatimonadota bacterium]
MLGTVIATLYGESDFRSLSRVARHTQILSCLRKAFGDESDVDWDDVVEALRRNNFVQEALFIATKHNRERGAALIQEGKVITLACECYPQLLIANLGVNAPPIFWISDPRLREETPWMNPDGSQRVCVSGVGCRQPLGVGLAIATKVGEWVASRGYFAVSGGAQGCDEAFGNSALKAGGQVVHILPHGLNKLPRNIFGYAMSVCPPNEAFSAARAMERNALIYGFGHSTVVSSARFRMGGSWQGAVAALKVNRPVMVADWTTVGFASTAKEYTEGTYGLAQRAFKNLGAFPLVLDLASFAQDIDAKLDEGLDWSFSRIAGEMNTGLFAS